MANIWIDANRRVGSSRESSRNFSNSYNQYKIHGFIKFACARNEKKNQTRCIRFCALESRTASDVDFSRRVNELILRCVLQYGIQRLIYSVLQSVVQYVYTIMSTKVEFEAESLP